MLENSLNLSNPTQTYVCQQIRVSQLCIAVIRVSHTDLPSFYMRNIRNLFKLRVQTEERKKKKKIRNATDRINNVI